MRTHGDGGVGARLSAKKEMEAGEPEASEDGGGLTWPLQREGGKGNKEGQTECVCACTHTHT